MAAGEYEARRLLPMRGYEEVVTCFPCTHDVCFVGLLLFFQFPLYYLHLLLNYCTVASMARMQTITADKQWSETSRTQLPLSRTVEALHQLITEAASIVC